MSNTPQLLIHAGMRPGEIVLARADGSEPIFLPPTDMIHGFTVGKHPTEEQWALLRHYCDQRAPDALLSFSSSQDADQALEELHRALLEPAPSVNMQPRAKISPLVIAGGVAIALIVVLFLGGRGKDAAQSPVVDATQPTASAQESAPPAQVPANGNETNPFAFLPTETQTPAPPPASAGDRLLRQIQQGASNSAPNQPVDAPAGTPRPPAPPAKSPGDSLLNQIKGN